MDKTKLTTPQKQALEQIKTLCADHGLTLDQIKHVLPPPTAKNAPEKTKNEKGGFLTAMLGYLGGTLIVAGFFFYASIVWGDLGSLGRVLLSLGTGMLCFFIGGVLQKKDDLHKAAPFLWTLAFLLIPTGLFVFLKEYIPGDDPIMGGVIVFGICAAMFSAMWMKTKTRTLFTYSAFFLIAFTGTAYEKLDLNTPGMWLFTGISILLTGYHLYKNGDRWGADRILGFGAVALTSSTYYFLGNTDYDILMVSIMLALVFVAYIMRCWQFLILSVIIFIALAGKHYGFTAGYRDNDLLRLTAAVTGISMAFTGHWIATHTISRKLIPGTWYFLGSCLFFSAVMGLLYDTPYDIAFIIFPSATLYISLQLRSRALMVSSLLAILSFISYYTFKYFADTVGWPLAMMVTGMVLLALGSLAMKMNKRIQEA